MGEYLLTGIDEEQWKYFKAACALKGITVKQSILNSIDAVVLVFKVRQGYSNNINTIKNEGD